MKLEGYKKILSNRLKRGHLLFVHVGAERIEAKLDSDGDPLHMAFNPKIKGMAEAQGWKHISAVSDPVGVKKTTRTRKRKPASTEQPKTEIVEK